MKTKQVQELYTVRDVEMLFEALLEAKLEPGVVVPPRQREMLFETFAAGLAAGVELAAVVLVREHNLPLEVFTKTVKRKKDIP